MSQTQVCRSLRSTQHWLNSDVILDKDGEFLLPFLVMVSSPLVISTSALKCVVLVMWLQNDPEHLPSSRTCILQLLWMWGKVWTQHWTLVRYAFPSQRPNWCGYILRLEAHLSFSVQVEGAFMQGVGLFTLEELRYSPQGNLYTRGPGTYKIPAFGDIPTEFKVSLLRDAPNDKAIFSSKVQLTLVVYWCGSRYGVSFILRISWSSEVHIILLQQNISEPLTWLIIS